MKAMMTEGQRIMNEFNTENRQVWMEIQKETGVDLNLTDWAPDPQKPDTIRLIQQRYFAGQ